jgi:hypothetical protein
MCPVLLPGSCPERVISASLVQPAEPRILYHHSAWARQSGEDFADVQFRLGRGEAFLRDTRWGDGVVHRKAVRSSIPSLGMPHPYSTIRQSCVTHVDTVVAEERMSRCSSNCTSITRGPPIVEPSRQVRSLDQVSKFWHNPRRVIRQSIEVSYGNRSLRYAARRGGQQEHPH